MSAITTQPSPTDSLPLMVSQNLREQERSRSNQSTEDSTNETKSMHGAALCKLALRYLYP
jgi:hypothetical protein